MRRYLLHITIALLSAFAGTAQAQIVDTVCALGGPSNLGVNSTFSGSSFDWHVNAGTILSGQGSDVITVDWPNVQGLYDAFVVETSPDGCIGDTVFAQVYVTEPSTTNILGPSRACEGEYVEFNAVDYKSSGKFLWSTGDTTETIAFIAKVDTTIYRVALNQDCDNDTVFHFLKVLPTPIVNVSTDALSDTISFNSYVNFQYTGSQAYQIDWYQNGYWVGNGASVNMYFETPGWNEVQSIASTGLCADTLTHMMFVEDDLKVHIPSAFSPNGDGLNDEWTFDGLGYDEYEVAIYDRWGGLIKQWNQNSPSSWDGTLHGNYLAPGAYTYRVRVMTINNHRKEFTGSITLIR